MLHNSPLFISRRVWAPVYPFSAASVYLFTVVLSTCGTPRPLEYIRPRLNWASASPCSARSVHSRMAVAKSPLWAASNPFWKSALHPSPTPPKSTAIVRQKSSGRGLRSSFSYGDYGKKLVNLTLTQIKSNLLNTPRQHKECVEWEVWCDFLSKLPSVGWKSRCRADTEHLSITFFRTFFRFLRLPRKNPTRKSK